MSQLSLIRLAILLSTLSGLVAGASAQAQTQAGADADYPSKPIRFVVSAAAGGGNDMIARIVAERLQAQRPDLRVLFMSGYTDDEIVRHGILYFETPFLQKPFTGTSLAEKAREVLTETTPKRWATTSCWPRTKAARMSMP